MTASGRLPLSRGAAIDPKPGKGRGSTGTFVLSKAVTAVDHKNFARNVAGLWRSKKGYRGSDLLRSTGTPDWNIPRCSQFLSCAGLRCDPSRGNRIHGDAEWRDFQRQAHVHPHNPGFCRRIGCLARIADAGTRRRTDMDDAPVSTMLHP